MGEKVFDLRKDPEQKDDIRHTSRGKLVAARLGQRYEEARSEAISRRNTAQAEGRMKGPNQGRGLVLPPGDYFCHHVRDAWFDEAWGEVKADMCTGRREEERIFANASSSSCGRNCSHGATLGLRGRGR